MVRPLRHTSPYSQQFRTIVSPALVGQKLLDFYETKFKFRLRSFWKEMILGGQITVNYGAVDPDYRLKDKDVIRTIRTDVQEPDVCADYTILHDQDGVLVVNKPAPLPVHPAGRYFKNSLLHILREQFPDRIFHTIHRLDTWTTGVLILGTDREKAQFLHQQVDKKTMRKIYGVMAVGQFPAQQFEVDQAIGRVDGPLRGVGDHLAQSKKCLTRFENICTRDGITLLKAEPVTGRTNQIRVHVQAAGGSVLNDPLYSPEQSEEIPFMGLHCRAMTFLLNRGDEPVTITAPWPEYFVERFGEELEKIRLEKN